MQQSLKNYKNNEIYFINWNEEINQIFVYHNDYNSKSHNSIDVFCGENLNLLNSIKISLLEFQFVTDLKFNPQTQQFIICYFDKIGIYNSNGNLISSTEIDGVISSNYYNENKLLLEIYEFSSNRSLGLFDTSNLILKKYELESLGHYNRNFVIEKTSNLLYGLCNAYENRMYLHLLNFEKDTLEFVCEKGLYCHRDEIENASIEINSLGDEYMFVADDDSEKKMVCVYNIYDQRKPLRIIPIKNDKIPILHSLLDKYLIVEYRNKFGLLNLEIKDSLYDNKSRTFNFHQTDGKIKIATNKKEGLIAFVFNKEIQILKIPDQSSEISEERKLKMREFIEKIKANQFLMSKVDEIY